MHEAFQTRTLALLALSQDNDEDHIQYYLSLYKWTNGLDGSETEQDTHERTTARVNELLPMIVALNDSDECPTASLDALLALITASFSFDARNTAWHALEAIDVAAVIARLLALFGREESERFAMKALLAVCDSLSGYRGAAVSVGKGDFPLLTAINETQLFDKLLAEAASAADEFDRAAAVVALGGAAAFERVDAAKACVTAALQDESEWVTDDAQHALDCLETYNPSRSE